jgi:hypothetical protein
MADGEIDVILPVAGLGDGEQRGDRPALDDVEAALDSIRRAAQRPGGRILGAVVDQAPFDVLGAAEVRFDPPAELREPYDLRIRQRRPRRRAPCRGPR